ncbi:uncharacterized protein LOC125178395, partial [Hyalella azteca]|uniref:Uncharacterized protein LOC125178395 n=1 Tax=Hyalella azteca TaxID=294128 RepID=A0A979FMU6_HYAAZ
IKQSAYARIDWPTEGDEVAASVSSSAAAVSRASPASRSAASAQLLCPKEDSLLPPLTPLAHKDPAVSSAKGAAVRNTSLLSQVKLDESADSLSISPVSSPVMTSVVSTLTDSQPAQASTYTFSSILSNPSSLSSLSKSGNASISLVSLSPNIQSSQPSLFNPPCAISSKNPADGSLYNPLPNPRASTSFSNSSSTLFASSALSFSTSSPLYLSSNSPFPPYSSSLSCSSSRLGVTVGSSSSSGALFAPCRVLHNREEASDRSESQQSEADNFCAVTEDMSNSNSNDVDILSGCAESLPVTDSSPSKRLRFSIEELADRNTCSPLLGMVRGGSCNAEEKLSTAPAIITVNQADVISGANSVSVTNTGTGSALSGANDVHLFGPDGPVSISFVQESVADAPVTHKKLDFCTHGVDSLTTKENHSASTGDDLSKPLVNLTSKAAKKVLGSDEKEISVSAASVDIVPHDLEFDVVADGSCSSSSASEDSELTCQASVSVSRSKNNRRLRRRAKMKRIEERRKWLAREKKLLFSGLKSHRPLTRSLDKQKKNSASIQRDHRAELCTEEMVTNEDALDDLQVDCDPLNVDTVDCVQVSVSDVDCADAGDAASSKNIDVGTNSELSDLTTFGKTAMDKENRSVGPEANLKTCSVVRSQADEFCSSKDSSFKIGRAKTPSISPMVLYSMPPYKEKEKQTRTTLMLHEKVKVIEAFLDGKSQRQIAHLHNIGKTQVSGIIKKREDILSLYRSNLLRGDKLTAKRQRRSEYALLNEHLIKWYRHIAAGTKITTGMLRAKALQIAPQLGYHDFKASNGWLATFKGNNNLKFSRAISNNNAGESVNNNNNNANNNNYHNISKAEMPERSNAPAMADEASYFEEADVETNTTEEEDPNPLLGTEGGPGPIMDPVGGSSLMGRVVGGGATGEGLPSAGGPCSGGFLTSPGLLQGAAAAILKCGVSVAGQSASNLPPQLPMEAFHLSRSAGAMDHNSAAAHHHPHHHHHHHHPAPAGPPSLSLAAASKGDAAAAAAAAGVLGYKSEEPLGYGSYDHHHHHHHQLQARMAPDQLAPQLAGRAMAGDQLVGRMGDGGGSASVASAAAASSSAAAAAVAAAARTSEYNYAPYTFPSGYYGYHFLGQY